MNLNEWEISNRNLVAKIESFYTRYQTENINKFKFNWIKANKEMCHIAKRKFKIEIEKQINSIKK